MPVKRKKNSFWPFIILLLVALLVAGYYYFYGFHRPDHWPWEPMQIPIARTVAVQPAPFSPIESVRCPQAADLLGETRDARLKEMDGKVDALVKTHRLTTDQAVAIKQHLHEHPDGDTHKMTDSSVDAWWTMTVKRGTKSIPIKLHYVHQCVCREWATISVPPLQPVRPRAYMPSRSENCLQITFNAHGPRVRWGVGSIDGPLMPSACNAQRQGPTGMFTAFYGICDSCVESAEVLKGILGDAVQIWHKYLYDAAEEEQTLRFERGIRTKVVYICITYPDGSIHAIAVGPEAWRGTNHVYIKDAMWGVPNGTEQKHLH